MVVVGDAEWFAIKHHQCGSIPADAETWRGDGFRASDRHLRLIRPGLGVVFARFRDAHIVGSESPSIASAQRTALPNSN